MIGWRAADDGRCRDGRVEEIDRRVDVAFRQTSLQTDKPSAALFDLSPSLLIGWRAADDGRCRDRRVEEIDV